MKILLFLIFALSISLSVAQKKVPLIDWNESSELEWKNFKGKPNKASSFKATTATVISFDVNYENQIIRIEVKNQFNPKTSWTKVDEEGNLLNHERLHFDISELFARKLRKKILQLELKNKSEKLLNEASKLYRSTTKELEQYQQAYDKATNHSIKEEEQKKWELKVKKQLDALSQYKESKLTLELK